MGKKSRLRLLEYGFTLWLVITLNFYLPRAMPGDPFLALSSEAPEEEIVLTEEQRQFFFFRHYGLDQPLGQQYLDYLAGLVRGDLGQNFYYKGEVSTIILSRLPWTVFLVLGAALGSTALGIALGSLAAWYRDRPVDRWLLIELLGLGEVPSFLLGLVLLLLFAVGLGWFPPGRGHDALCSLHHLGRHARRCTTPCLFTPTYLAGRIWGRQGRGRGGFLFQVANRV